MGVQISSGVLIFLFLSDIDKYKKLLYTNHMKYEHFTIRDGKLLCWRLGGINAVKQAHYPKNFTPKEGGMCGTHKPPVSRGFWAFPYPHYDLFFCYHQWSKRLPKVYDPKDEETLMKKIRKTYRPSLFYTDHFYSHLGLHGQCDNDTWFYWDSPKDWARIATSQIAVIDVIPECGGMVAWDYAKDHLEIFV